MLGLAQEQHAHLLQERRHVAGLPCCSSAMLLLPGLLHLCAVQQGDQGGEHVEPSAAASSMPARATKVVRQLLVCSQQRLRRAAAPELRQCLAASESEALICPGAAMGRHFSAAQVQESSYS